MTRTIEVICLLLLLLAAACCCSSRRPAQPPGVTALYRRQARCTHCLPCPPLPALPAVIAMSSSNHTGDMCMDWKSNHMAAARLLKDFQRAHK
jgi:hypothetical protein